MSHRIYDSFIEKTIYHTLVQAAAKAVTKTTECQVESVAPHIFCVTMIFASPNLTLSSHMHWSMSGSRQRRSVLRQCLRSSTAGNRDCYPQVYKAIFAVWTMKTTCNRPLKRDCEMRTTLWGSYSWCQVSQTSMPFLLEVGGLGKATLNMRCIGTNIRSRRHPHATPWAPPHYEGVGKKHQKKLMIRDVKAKKGKLAIHFI